MDHSKIEWTDHTFNPWAGCTKVSPACDNCYAESDTKRHGFVKWGPDALRRVTTSVWRDPPKLNRQALKEHRRFKVFCGSWCDIFEGRKDTREPLGRLFSLIGRTPHLDWQLLTKRPNNIRKLTPWAEGEWPDNVWVGSTVENQEWADRRLSYLLQVPSKIRFVSVEPMLGPVNLRPHLGSGLGKINWVICGGESGHHARGCDDTINWYRDLRDQCLDAEVPFFFKQWGNFRHDGRSLIKLSKKNPDHTLDGAIWQQFPL